MQASLYSPFFHHTTLGRRLRVRSGWNKRTRFPTTFIRRKSLCRVSLLDRISDEAIDLHADTKENQTGPCAVFHKTTCSEVGFHQLCNVVYGGNPQAQD